jgi:hypothetical protein
MRSIVTRCRRRKRGSRPLGIYAALSLALLGLLAGMQPAAAHGRGQVAYSSIPMELPGNVASQGYEATLTSEFGDEVELGATSGRRLRSLEVVMSSWACQTGRSYTGDCASAPESTFTHPITANIYAVDESGPTPVPGALLASVTRTVELPYRPSADPANCTGGRWYDATAGTCYNGFAQPIRLTFPRGIVLPEKVIWTIAFDTSHAGYNPLGESTACYTSSGGCPYDSLNVGAQSVPGEPHVGNDVDANGVFLNSAVGSSYCDGGTGGVGILRLDTPCWTGFAPLGEINTRRR